MWPFKKAKVIPPVSCGDMTARYDKKLEYWEFECGGLEFHISGIPFNEAAFDCAREVVPVIRRLDAEIRERVIFKEELKRAERLFLINSVRRWISVKWIDG